MVPPKRLVWFVMLVAFTVFPIALTLAKTFATAPVLANGSAGPPILPGIAVAALGAAVVWSVTKLRLRGEVGGPIELPAFSKFQADSQVALALAELGSLAAWAAPGATWRSMLPFMAGTIVVNLLFVLPAGLTYFRLLEEGGDRPSGS